MLYGRNTQRRSQITSDVSTAVCESMDFYFTGVEDQDLGVVHLLQPTVQGKPILSGKVGWDNNEWDEVFGTVRNPIAESLVETLAYEHPTFDELVAKS